MNALLQTQSAQVNLGATHHTLAARTDGALRLW